MLYEAHRGDSAEFPENTMAAFRAASAQRFDMIELDPAFTSDGVCVVLHDATLNRTCRHDDGSPLTHEVRISDITFWQSQQYDAGIAKDVKFAHERIPRLADVLAYAEETGITLKLDNRIASFAEEKQTIIFDLLRSYIAKVVITCPSVGYAAKIHTLFPESPLHYDGVTDEETLIALRKAVGGAALTVWCPMRSQKTSWVRMPFADETLCATVKKYADLGLWILSTDEEADEAERLGADIIETTGECKKPNVLPGMVDMHTHTDHSHDSKCKLDDACEYAIKHGLYGLTVTDHCDTGNWRLYNQIPAILASVADVKRARKVYGDRLKLYTGVEIGEGMWYRDHAREMAHAADFDVVLGSVHILKYEKPYSITDLSYMNDEDIDVFLTHYFEDLTETVDEMEFDVMPHLTCPLRYLLGKYGKTVHMERYDDYVNHILSTIIRRHIALEINTSSFDKIGTMPSYDYVKRYKEMGGYLITICSDAHAAENNAKAFETVRNDLKAIGFRNLYYYVNRIPIPYSL